MFIWLPVQNLASVHSQDIEFRSIFSQHNLNQSKNKKKLFFSYCVGYVLFTSLSEYQLLLPVHERTTY